MTKKEVIERYGIEEYNRRKEQHKEYLKQNDYNRKYDKANPEKAKEKVKRYREKHRDKVKAYYKTVKGRAVMLVNAYNMTDKKLGRYENNITSDYLVNIILPKGCAYCGETNPLLLGADRIDNNKGHSADNIVCACAKCNKNRHKEEFVSYFMKRYMESILY